MLENTQSCCLSWWLYDLYINDSIIQFQIIFIKYK